ncbi:MAG: prepilin-type N-terminal cleavage/methylation domain-containing protein [Phycisphaerales bacterium]|nr:prepilin-type N-terminal cleavage/methylation domain-containing protein [Phycisphaerales bacterium]
MAQRACKHKTLHAGRGLRSCAGFTLIELVVVVVLIGVLAVVAIPSMASARTSRANGAAQQIGQDLTYARRRAQATGVGSWVVFTPAQSMYSVMAENAGTPGRLNAATITDPATGMPMTVRLSASGFEGVSIQSTTLTNNEVGFDRFGRPVLATGAIMTSNGSVTLSSGATVSIAAQTGLVTVSAP